MFNLKKPHICAELGINHNGDMKTAMKLIDMAGECGCNSVKVQFYRTEDFSRKDTEKTIKYIYNSEVITENEFEFFKTRELSADNITDLQEYSDKKDLGFICTPTSVSGVNFLKSINVDAIKIASDMAKKPGLVHAAAKTKLPLIISTGHLTYIETQEMINSIRKISVAPIVILYCESQYPAETFNLNIFKNYKHLFKPQDIIVGYSNHVNGEDAALHALINGAMWLETHITLDKNDKGHDHWFSTTPEELRQLVEAVK